MSRQELPGAGGLSRLSDRKPECRFPSRAPMRRTDSCSRLDTADDAVDVLRFGRGDTEVDQTAVVLRLAPTVADVRAPVDAGPSVNGHRRWRWRVDRPGRHVRGPRRSRCQHHKSGRSKEEFLHRKIPCPMFDQVRRAAAIMPFPRQRPNPVRKRSDNAVRVLIASLAAPLEISCDPFATVGGKSGSQRHLGRSSEHFFVRAGR
jgi:hypothetical protein